VAGGSRDRKAGRHNPVVQVRIQEDETRNSVGLDPDQPRRRHRSVDLAYRLHQEQTDDSRDHWAKSHDDADREAETLPIEWEIAWITKRDGERQPRGQIRT